MKLRVFLFVAVLVVVTGEGRGFSSREMMEEMLRERNIQLGYDEERGRIVAVKTHRASMKAGESSRELPFGCYDFLDDANDDFETRRFKAAWKAYSDGLAEIATFLKASVNNTETNDEDGKVVSMAVEKAASVPLNGVVTIEMCESVTADGEYEVTIAVCQSVKRQKAYLSGLNGSESRPGRHSLAEWIERKAEVGIVCPQTYCDNEGVWWRIAGVPVELDEGRNSKKVAMLTEKAKRYAYEAAMRTLAVQVSTRTSMSVNLEVGKGDDRVENKVEKTVKIDPINTILPVDPSQVRWFELDRKNPLTGKPVRCVVAALRSGNSRNVAAKPASAPAKAETREATAARQMKAAEQAHRFCVENELELGFNPDKKVATLLSTETFDYEPQMSDEEFARLRYMAVKKALVAGAVDIIRQIAQKMQHSDDKGRLHVFGRDCFFDWRDLCFDMGSFAEGDDFDKESLDSSLIKAVKGEFVWNAKLERSRFLDLVSSSIAMELPLYGLSIRGQFESLARDKYSVALIIRLDLEKFQEKILAFSEGRAVAPGKMSLQRWMSEQDFSLIAGPRQYVDDEGTIWALGIVPAGEAQQPYGNLLDAAARDCAAFAFGGTFKVAAKTGEASGSIEFTATDGVAGNSYPRELELYFHRPYTHPLTGRKGVVAICALRSGAWKASREIHERKNEKILERLFEAGMRARLREQLKTLANELDKVKADDDKTRARIRELRHEIFWFEGELQQERSLRKKNRERTTKKLAELRRKVLELKGGKGNEE